MGEALAVAPDATIIEAVKALVNGTGVTAPDTVPLCLWIAAHAADGFEQALWRTVGALGDRDTTCAIVGGILALSNPAALAAIAQGTADWIKCRSKS